jgi:hypothetical protein
LNFVSGGLAATGRRVPSLCALAQLLPTRVTPGRFWHAPRATVPQRPSADPQAFLSDHQAFLSAQWNKAEVMDRSLKDWVICSRRASRGMVAEGIAGPAPPGAVRWPQRFPQKFGFVPRVCMGAPGT